MTYFFVRNSFAYIIMCIFVNINEHHAVKWKILFFFFFHKSGDYASNGALCTQEPFVCLFEEDYESVTKSRLTIINVDYSILWADKGIS